MTTAIRSLARRAAMALSAAGLAAGLGLAAPAIAHADPGVTVGCESSGQMYFSPGVQLFPLAQHIMYDGETGTCNDNSGVGIRAASLSADFKSVVASCELAGFRTGSGTGTIQWVLDDGSVVESTVELEFDHSVINVASISGTITSGLFTGHHFSSSFTTNLLAGAAKCTAGAPLGGAKRATLQGQFSID